jgi:hypothetical protein
MKIKGQYIIPIILITFFITLVYGFPPGMVTNASTSGTDLDNVTHSDMDIVLVQHLIEVDAVQLESEGKMFVRETLLFKNIGTKNFSGTLRIWVPDGAERIRIGKVEMMKGGRGTSLNAVQKGNIISWKDSIKVNESLPPLYALEYTVPAESKGTITKSRYYLKKLVYPTLVNKMPASVVLKVSKRKGESISIRDEQGRSISSSGNPREEEDNSLIYTWELPTFKELNIEISKPAITPAGIAGYAVLGLLILLVFSYPAVRKRSDKLQEMEDKIRSSLKKLREKTVQECFNQIRYPGPLFD